MKNVQVAYAKELKSRILYMKSYVHPVDQMELPEKCRLQHLEELCQRLIDNHELMSETKCARWVGFIQGVLCTIGCSSVEIEKRAYKRCKKEVLKRQAGG